MRLEAKCTMTLEVKQPTPLVAMLRPRSGEGQWVVSDAYEVEPFVPIVEYSAVFGKRHCRSCRPT